MKILVFTKKNDYYNIIKQLVSSIDSSIPLERVSIAELANLTLSGPEHLLVLDDALFECLNVDFFEIIKKNQNKLLVFLKDKDQIKKYLNFNVLDYYFYPINWKRVDEKLKGAIKYRQRMDELNHTSNRINKFILKRKTDVIFIDYDEILFFKKKERLVVIHTKSKKFESHESLKNIMTNLPRNFIRTHNAYVVNFDHVYEVTEEKNRSYKIAFKDYEESVCMSRQRAEHIKQDKFDHYRLSFIENK